MKNIILFRSDEGIEPVEGVGPNPVSGHPVTHVWRFFTHPSGRLTAGLWSCRGGTFEIPAHTSTEMCTILEGEAVIEHADGSRVTVVPGDSFVIPFGAHTIWHVEGYVKKSFVCHFMEDDVPSGAICHRQS